MKIQQVLSVSFFILTSAASIFAQNTPKIEGELTKLMETYRVPGLSVAVVKDNKIIYTKALGVKDIEQNIPLASDDIFRIASISKSFCATAIMQLVEQKKLNLDDEVSKLIGFKVSNPNFPSVPITLRMLLSHTSSINDSAGYFTYEAIDPAINNGNTKCYSDYAPGTTFKYCNLNFTLIGAIIERASGERFDNYIKNHIFKPLNIYGGYNVDSLDKNKLVSLYTIDKNTKEFKKSVQAYTPNHKIWSNYKLGYSAYSFSPTGGVKISAPDLAKVMLMHLNKGTYNGVQIISQKSAELMQSPSTLVDTGAYYGLAIRNLTFSKLAGGNLLVGHTGSASGLKSVMLFNPANKYGFVIICSSAEPFVYKSFSGMSKVLADGVNILYKNFIK